MKRDLETALMLALALLVGCAEDVGVSADEADGAPAALVTYGGLLQATATPGSPRDVSQNGATMSVSADGNVYLTLGITPSTQSVTFRQPTIRLVCDTGRYKVMPSRTYADVTVSQGHLIFYYNDGFKCDVGKLVSVTASASF